MPANLLVTLDVSGAPILDWTGDVPQFRRLVTVTVDGGTALDANNVELYVKYRGAEVAAATTGWTLDGNSDPVAELSLNTTALEAIFATRGVQAIVPLSWELYYDDELLASGMLPCLNNPDPLGAPEDIDDDVTRIRAIRFTFDGDGSAVAANSYGVDYLPWDFAPDTAVIIVKPSGGTCTFEIMVGDWSTTVEPSASVTDSNDPAIAAGFAAIDVDLSNWADVAWGQGQLIKVRVKDTTPAPTATWAMLVIKGTI